MKKLLLVACIFALHVMTAGAAVPFRFHGNVMSVTLQPSAKPVLLTLEK